MNRSPPTGSITMSTPPPRAPCAWSFQAPSERTTSSAPASRATRSFSSLETTAIVRRAEALGDLQRRGPDAAGGAVHEHRLALGQPPAELQREVGGVVVEDERRALGEVQLVGQLEDEVVGRDGRPPPRRRACRTRRRDRRPDRRRPPGALRTTPATSLPGTNGSGGLIWYSPRVCSSSGNETPAACTSTTHAAARVSWVRRLGLRRRRPARGPRPGRSGPRSGWPSRCGTLHGHQRTSTS